MSTPIDIAHNLCHHAGRNSLKCYRALKQKEYRRSKK